MNDVFISYPHIDDQPTRCARTFNAQRLTLNAQVVGTASEIISELKRSALSVKR